MLRNGLSPREQQVLKLFLAEYSGKDAARELGISVKTYSTYKTTAMKKLGVLNDVALVRLAMNTGLQSELADVSTVAVTPAKTAARAQNASPASGSAAVSEFLRTF